ncbi:MAG: nucleotidyl transferase AbiEii/AbiGii toxin family protein [Opitutales bacterium]
MHDLPSLFAGKLHVLCCREDRAKGRDFFDLAWYLSQEIEPNLEFLNATIQALEAKPWPAKEWKSHLLKRIQKVDFKRLQRDIEPFLIDSQDAMLLDSELLTSALARF